MDYKKKLKQRLYIAVIYIALGVMMIAGTAVIKTDNDFMSSFGFAIIVMGLVRIRNYRIITKDEDTIRKQQIIETDERNLSIIQRAKSAAFSIYLLISCAVVIVTALIDMPDVAKWIGYSQFVLVIIYWICYWIIRKKS